jgi:hypothetical protein
MKMLNLFNSSIQQTSAQHLPLLLNFVTVHDLFDGAFLLELRETFLILFNVLLLVSFSFFEGWYMMFAVKVTNTLLTIYLANILEIYNVIQNKRLDNDISKECVSKAIFSMAYGLYVYIFTAMPTAYLYGIVNIVFENTKISPILVFNGLTFILQFIVPSVFFLVNSNMLIGSRVVTFCAFAYQFNNPYLFFTISTQIILLLIGEKNRQVLFTSIKAEFIKLFNK